MSSFFLGLQIVSLGAKSTLQVSTRAKNHNQLSKQPPQNPTVAEDHDDGRLSVSSLFLFIVSLEADTHLQVSTQAKNHDRRLTQLPRSPTVAEDHDGGPISVSSFFFVTNC